MADFYFRQLRSVTRLIKQREDRGDRSSPTWKAYQIQARWLIRKTLYWHQREAENV